MALYMHIKLQTLISSESVLNIPWKDWSFNTRRFSYKKMYLFTVLFILLIYGLFNDAVSSSAYMALNDRMFSE
jgi:hypothetical protein